MHRALFLSATVVAVLNAPALAADMPLKAPQGMAAPYDWTGFYVGILGGHAWGDGSTENITGGKSFPPVSLAVGIRAGLLPVVRSVQTINLASGYWASKPIWLQVALRVIVLTRAQ